jgi:myo-inositol 2-dehydrogenase / D-chiro-inositol 1-dehydrogenase
MPSLGVGFIGAGAVTQAIHLPVLAALSDRFHVAHIVDVDPVVAATVARRAGAVSGTDVNTLLTDPAVDVVAICSPHQFHAEQIEQACAAGKRAILCEKPLAMSQQEAQRVLHACTEASVPLIVGAMHTWDPAYVAATQQWGDLPTTCSLVRSVIYLPDNQVMVDSATEAASCAAASSAAVSPSGPAVAPRSPMEARVRNFANGVLGLAVHNAPLVRQLVPACTSVTCAVDLQPWGYALSFHTDETAVQMIGLMPGKWQPDWTFQAWGASSELHVKFPPSYVMTGSARAELRTRGRTTTWHENHNGYHMEWTHLADVVAATAVHDVTFALDVANHASTALRTHLERHAA